MFSEFFNNVGNWFSISKPVTGTSDMSSNDFFNTQNALTSLGHSNPQTSDIGEGLKSFQVEQGLKVDGVMNPGGPTESALGKALANQALTSANTDQALPSHVSIIKPESSNDDNRSWSASASFGPKLEKPTTLPKFKSTPFTDITDPLAKKPSFSPKSKTEMDKLWAQVPGQSKSIPQISTEQETVMDRFKKMMSDPRYTKDRAYTQHLQGQFKKAFPGNVQRDETSQMIQPKAVIKPNEVKEFRPSTAKIDGQLTYTVPDGNTHNVQDQSNLTDAYDPKSHTLFKTDTKGNYFNFKGEPVPLPPDVKKRLDASYLDNQQLSPAGVEEMGEHLAHHQSRSDYTPERLKATEQAIKSTYNEEEQKRIRQYAEQNPHGVMPENHDVWRGNVHEMGESLKLDQNLIKDAGNDAIPAMSAFMSYRHLKTPESQQSALKEIHKLAEKGHPKLADLLFGNLAVSLIQPAFHPTTQSEKELLIQQKNHRKLGNTIGAISSLPKIPTPAAASLKGIEENFKRASKKDGLELKRRKKTH